MKNTNHSSVRPLPSSLNISPNSPFFSFNLSSSPNFNQLINLIILYHILFIC